MTEIHYCETCQDHPAEVELRGRGGVIKHLCTAPECLMAAGICPSCQVSLEVKVLESGEEIYSCPECDFDHTYQDLGQP